MGILVDGRWTNESPDTSAGRFIRPESQFRSHITADGASGFTAEAGRYHLYVSYGCPWAHRAIIFRALKGLEGLVSMSIALPDDRRDGWRYGTTFPGATADQVNGFTWLHQAYTAADPGYTGKVTVPTLWDKAGQTIVNNESSEIIRMFNSAFDEIGAKPGDYYPKLLAAEIDRVNELVYAGLNNGVYRTGFSTTQAAYDEAVVRVFNCLDTIEQRLGQQRYLAGDAITEADWRLFVTLVRFDAVYHHAFKCMLRPLSSYHHLSNYLRELYQVPGVAATVRLDHIVTSYYSSERVNPNGVVPIIPAQDFARAHDRGCLATSDALSRAA